MSRDYIVARQLPPDRTTCNRPTSRKLGDALVTQGDGVRPGWGATGRLRKAVLKPVRGYAGNSSAGCGATGTGGSFSRLRCGATRFDNRNAGCSMSTFIPQAAKMESPIAKRQNGSPFSTCRPVNLFPRTISVWATG